MVVVLPHAIRSQIVVTANGCWHWTGYVRPDGYGEVGYKKRRWRSHRLVYELLLGPFPPGLVSDHTCHTRDRTCPGGSACMHRRCCNPAHVEPVTPGVNCGRGERTWRTHCPSNHEYTPENTRFERSARGTMRHCRECNREATRAWYRRRRAA